MRVAFHDHQGKGRRLAAALIEAGHQIVGARGDVALLDCDVPMEPYKSLCASHERVVLYPHGGGANGVGNDGQWPVHPHVVADFVIGEGQAEVARLCANRVPEVIGWPFSDLLPFRAGTPNRVLLALQHPSGTGWFPPGSVESHRRLHDALAVLPVHLTVRYVADLAGLGDHGITPAVGVEYQQARLDIDDGRAAIEAADVVVAAEGTFPSLAVALGCPTVMFDQIRPDHYLDSTGETFPARSWDRYRDLVRYPLDADDGDLADLLERATAGDGDINEWRERFVGEQMEPEAFVKAFESWA